MPPTLSDANPSPPLPDAGSLTLQIYPARVLREKAKPITDLPPSPRLKAIIERMFQMMVEEEGIGLAAPQVGLGLRLFVVNVPPNEERSADSDPPTATRGPVAYINPRFTNPTGAAAASEEGCLSLPDIRGDVLRPPTITITALDIDGKEFTQTATGLLARCWQHEMDHLDGVLIIDKFTQLSRLKNRRAVKDLEAGR